jgi:hypothetical protein
MSTSHEASSSCAQVTFVLAISHQCWSGIPRFVLGSCNAPKCRLRVLAVLLCPASAAQCTHTTRTSAAAAGSSKPLTRSNEGRCSTLAFPEGHDNLQCGICFEFAPADSMMSATLPAAMASSSRAAGHCSHKFCAGCMQQYVCCELQVRPGSDNCEAGRWARFTRGGRGL